MSNLSVNVAITGAQEVRLGLIRLSSPAARRQAIGDGGQAALTVIKGYYQAKGRPFWVNPALPTHGPGRRPTQWWRSTETAWAMLQPNSYDVKFQNETIGLAHKVTGGTIRAKRKKFLTIPVDPRAHGLTAKTFARTIAPLFAAKGMLMYTDEQTGDAKAAYALRKSVTHRPWPGALPPESSYLDAFIDEALNSLIATVEEA